MDEFRLRSDLISVQEFRFLRAQAPQRSPLLLDQDELHLTTKLCRGDPKHGETHLEEEMFHSTAMMFYHHFIDHVVNKDQQTETKSNELNNHQREKIHLAEVERHRFRRRSKTECCATMSRRERPQ